VAQELFKNDNLRLDNSRPLYQQIIDAVKRAVARGDLGPGHQIPSQRELAQELQVNPNTVQRAYREMEYSGLVTTLRGTGTFITSDATILQDIRRDMATQALRRFLDELRALGYSGSEVLDMVAGSIGAGTTEQQKDGDDHDR